MRAVILERARRLAIRDREIPQPGPGELLIEVEGCAIAERDLDAWYTGTGVLPRVPGSEIVGRVASAPEDQSPRIVPLFGARSTHFAPGTRVVVSPFLERAAESPGLSGGFSGDGGSTVSGSRARGRRGWQEPRGGDGGVIGIDRDGGFQQFLVVPAQQCHSVPPEAPLHALLCVPALAEAVSLLDELQVEEDETVLIVGAEGVGACAAIAAAARGAIPILVDTNEARLEQVAAAGVENRINPFRTSVPDELEWMTLNGESTVDAVLESTGEKEALPGLLAVVGAGSRIGFVRPIDVEYSVATLVDNGLHMVGLGTLLPAIEPAVEIALGTEVATLIAATFTLEEIVERMGSLAASRRSLVKAAVLMDPIDRQE